MSAADALAAGPCPEDSALGSVLSDPRFTARLKRQQAQCEGGESKLDQLFAQKKKEFKPSALESALAQRLAAQREKANAREEDGAATEEAAAKRRRDEDAAPPQLEGALAQRLAQQREKANTGRASVGGQPDAGPKTFKSQANPELAKILARQRQKLGGSEAAAEDGKASEAMLRQLITPSRRRSAASGSPVAKQQPQAAKLPAAEGALPALPGEAAPATAAKPMPPTLPLAAAFPERPPPAPAPGAAPAPDAVPAQESAPVEEVAPVQEAALVEEAAPASSAGPAPSAGPALTRAASFRKERYQQASSPSAELPQGAMPRAPSQRSDGFKTPMAEAVEEEAKSPEGETWETPRSEGEAPPFAPPSREASAIRGEACGCVIA